MNTSKSNFGDRLRRLRREKGLNQDELADKAGMNRSYISLLENNHSSPTMEIVEKLASGLGVSILNLVQHQTESVIEYDASVMIEIYEGLKDLLDDEDEMMLIQPTEAEKAVLKGIRFSSGFKPDKRFYRDALLAYRRRKRSNS